MITFVGEFFEDYEPGHPKCQRPWYKTLYFSAVDPNSDVTCKPHLVSRQVEKPHPAHEVGYLKVHYLDEKIAREHWDLFTEEFSDPEDALSRNQDWYVGYAHVHENYRGQKIARDLYQAAAEHLASLDEPLFSGTLRSDDANAFWQKAIKRDSRIRKIRQNKRSVYVMDYRRDAA